MPPPLRLVLAGLTAFATAWGALSLTTPAHPRAAGVAPTPSDLPAWSPSFGQRLSCRRLRFNGTPTLVARWRFREDPDGAMDRLAKDLANRSKMEGRELAPGLAMTPEDAQAWREKRLFLAGTAGSAGTDRRLLWREPSGAVVEVLIRPEGAGSQAIWTERQEAGWVPDGKPCPGREPEGLLLPAGWKRIYCIDGGEGGSSTLLNCYAAPTSPTEALETLDAALTASGWMPQEQALPGRSYTRKGCQCLVSVERNEENAEHEEGVEVTLAERPLHAHP